MSEDEATFWSKFFLVLLILYITFRTGRASIDVDTSLETDKQVLLQLKLFLQKNNHVNNGLYIEWRESDPSPCQWPGIVCSGNEDRVTGIKLNFWNLSGKLFTNFSQLTELTVLDLSLNTISGPIPADLNECSSLQYLNLSHNLIEGELSLTGLVNLEVLDITLNRLSGGIRLNFPALCRNLITLNISMNSFVDDLTNCFSECSKLKYLDVSSNSFTGQLWSSILTLTQFSASENNFTGAIPRDYFTSYCSLEALDLSSNGFFGGFPYSIANCSSLTSLNIWGNNFTGTIPASIGSLLELQNLILGSNSFDRRIPLELLNCTKLAFLDLSNNNFGGAVQSIFGRFISLKHIILHTNSYTGGLSSSGILALENIERLDLSYNDFNETLPVEIGAMPNLKFLVLAFNHFTGSIPQEFGRISTLQALDLSYNELTGSIPSSIGNLGSLLWLMLSNNKLSGRIPPELGNCSSLLWLNLADNMLNGTIPAELSSVGNNPGPTFMLNRKDSGIPAGSGECFMVERWLPATYPPFSFAYMLMNRKSCRSVWDKLLKGIGVIPLCPNSSPVRTLAISGYIQLTNNLLAGDVPTELGRIKNLSLLHLNANKLTGRLPPSIGNLSLVMLNVSNNSFSGDIPPELGGIKCLQWLDLSYNNFSGTLQSLSKLTELDKFNVSYNPLLAGPVPGTRQLATFDNTSFLGDPLITFSASSIVLFKNSTESYSVAGSGGSMVVFWVFSGATVMFVVLGIVVILVSMVACPKKHRSPDPDPEPEAEAEVVKVFTGGEKAAGCRFTYRDVVEATEGFADRAVVGRGGSAVVYGGWLPDGRRVAVKRLLRGEEYLAEVEAAAAGGWHRNVVPVVGWCSASGERLLVYEYMEGGSLEEVVGDWRRMGWRRRAEAAAGVAAGVLHLHRAGVVHRDVKASNVMLDGEGAARVTDFGLARVVAAGESGVSTVAAGTVGYVAPEYGSTWRATARGDVYSYGVLAIELATGRRAVEEGREEGLVEWARRTAAEGWAGLRGPAAVVAAAAEADGRAVEAEGMAEMCALLRVAMRCTAEAPASRPDMEEALAMLRDTINIYIPA